MLSKNSKHRGITLTGASLPPLGSPSAARDRKRGPDSDGDADRSGLQKLGSGARLPLDWENVICGCYSKRCGDRPSFSDVHCWGFTAHKHFRLERKVAVPSPGTRRVRGGCAEHGRAARAPEGPCAPRTRSDSTPVTKRRLRSGRDTPDSAGVRSVR